MPVIFKFKAINFFSTQMKIIPTNHVMFMLGWETH